MSKKIVFKAPVETGAAKAKRLFNEHVRATTPFAVRWSDASPAVREFWMSKVKAEEVA